MTPDELRSKLIRNFNEAKMETLDRAPHYDGSCGARLARGTAALKMGASVDILPPGKRGCPYHFHYEEEEMFIVLEGEGTLRVAGEMLPIREGDIMFIPPGPEYPHQILNTSDKPLKFLSISTMAQTEICEYPDSGKYLAYSRTTGAKGPLLGDGRMHRVKDDLDYWDGEV
ncbi:MAG: cupin domain-containing protein [Betaproteobacteria bacterium]